MTQRSNVPCNGCTACCQGDMILLHPEHGDDPKQYACHDEVNPIDGKTYKTLDHQANGNCVYLGESGCTIHDRAPIVCREFDCRIMFSMLDRNTRRRMVSSKLFSKEVLAAGRKRLHTLEK